MKKPSIKAPTKIATKNDLRKVILNLHGMRSGREVLSALPWKAMHGSTRQALVHLLSGQEALKKRYHAHLKKNSSAGSNHEMTFALDGRLVGDIGELIAAELFPLELLGTKSKNVDAVTIGRLGKKVQIKATFKDESLTIKHGADYFIGLQLNNDGKYRIIYNGKARPVMKYLRMPKAKGHSGRAGAGTKLEPISLEAWAILNLDVALKDRIPYRNS